MDVSVSDRDRLAARLTLSIRHTVSSCMVLHRTLTTLGMPEDLIKVHFLLKATSIFKPVEQERLETLIRDSLNSKPGDSEHEARIIVVDQGSRPNPPLVRRSEAGANVRTLIIDHHQSNEFPEEAEILSACHSPPIATSSLLSYLCCRPLHPSLAASTAVYCILGVFGDLSPSEINWGSPKSDWPDSKEMLELGEEVKRIGKSSLTSAVGAINAPRRTAEYNVKDAWDILFKAEHPKDVAKSSLLQEARDKVAKEVERCTHTAPKFSKDGRVALLRIDSGYQGGFRKVSYYETKALMIIVAVHPVIATRWAGTLKGAKKLQMIMVENPGHNPDPDLTSFSCRITNSLRKLPEDERPNLIALLKEYGELVSAKDSTLGPS